MSWFKKNKKVCSTKMFVNYLSENEEKRTATTKGITGSVALGGQGIAIDMALNVAPKLVEQGMELMANTLKSLAYDKAFPTNVRRNFDVINPNKLSLPSKITLLRGNFSHDSTMKGTTFGDGEEMNRNQVVLLGNKELHIEIDVIQSKDKSAIYFQTSSYFYSGQSLEGNQTDEILLAFAFLPAGRTIVDPNKTDFKNFLHFEALSPNIQYNFKSESGYDTSYQSPWMSTPLDEVEPYTMVIQIQEIREGNSFAKLLQTVYVENKAYMKTALNEQISTLKDNTI